MGVQTEYQLAASGTEPLATVAEMAVGQTVKIIVQQGVNGSQQGVASEPILLTLPAAKTRGIETFRPPRKFVGTNPGFCEIPPWEFEFAIADGARFAARYAREPPRNLRNCE